MHLLRCFVLFAVFAHAAEAQTPGSAALPWSVFLGGSGFEECEQWNTLAIATNGDVLLCGRTASPNFPRTTGGGLQGLEDGFAVRIRDGVIVWSMLLGGGGRDAARAIVEVDGDVYVAGRTSSTNFPTTTGAPQTTCGGGTAPYGDGFVVRLTNTLSSAPTIAYATYLGGSGDDSVMTLAHSAMLGKLVVGGWSASTNFPTAGVPLQAANANVQPPPTGQLGADGFLALLDTTNGALVAATYLGGANDDLVLDVAETLFCPGGGSGCGGGATALTRFVASGRTMSANFPTTPNGYDLSLAGVQDAFVVVLDETLSTLVHGTYLGGSGDEMPFSMALGSDPVASGSIVVHLGGQTTSANFPTTPGALRTTFSGGGYYGIDAFVARLDLGLAVPSQLVWSTYLGGPGDESIMDLEVERSGMVTAVGLAGSPPFQHTTQGALQTTFQGGGGAPVGPTDGFVVRLDPSRTGNAQLVYGTFLGGSMGQDNAMDVALTADGGAVVAGWTWSNDFPANGTNQGNSDVFVCELSLLPNGVTRYGEPSPGCVGAFHLAVNSQPSPGNAAFEVHANGALPMAPGALFLGAASPAAIPIPPLGIGLWLSSAPVGITTLADAQGFARFAVPIPPGYVWGTTGLGLQAIWLDVFATGCAPFAASDALR